MYDLSITNSTAIPWPKMPIRTLGVIADDGLAGDLVLRCHIGLVSLDDPSKTWSDASLGGFLVRPLLPGTIITLTVK